MIALTLCQTCRWSQWVRGAVGVGVGVGGTNPRVGWHPCPSLPYSMDRCPLRDGGVWHVRLLVVPDAPGGVKKTILLW